MKSNGFVDRKTLEYDRVENGNTVIFAGTASSSSAKSYRLPADAIWLDRGRIVQSATGAIADLSHRAMTGSTALVPPCGSVVPRQVWCARMTVGLGQDESGFKHGRYGDIDNRNAGQYGIVDRLYYGTNLDFRFERNYFADNNSNDLRPRQLQLTLGERRYDISTAVKMGRDGGAGNWRQPYHGGVRWERPIHNPQFNPGDRVTLRMILVSPVVRLAQDSRDFTVNEGDQFAINLGLDNPAVSDLDVKVNLYSKRTYPLSDELGVHTVTIPAGKRQASLQIQTTADEFLNNDQEVLLTVLPTDRYSVDGIGKFSILNGHYVDELDSNGMATGNQVFDVNGDNVSVGWENCNSTYDNKPTKEITIAENVGKAEFNVVLGKGLVGYDFSLVLVNMEGSASRHNDYVDADATGILVMKAFERTATASVGIVDSRQLEDTESF